jgi:hypothetical protein
MASKVISLKDGLSHLQDNISNSENCKETIIKLFDWIIDFNNGLTENNQVFCFIREYVNIGFAIDRDNNRSKTRKPNFMIIKLPGTDREFKELHIDIDLGENGYSPFAHYLIQRPSNLPRWILLCNKVTGLGLENLKKLFLVAHERKGGRA